LLLQSFEQREADQNVLDGLPPELQEEMKKSNRLRKELEKLLTEQQWQQLAEGKEVPLDVSRLPKSLQKLATDFMDFRINRQKIGANLGNLSDWSIVFLPNAASPLGLLGINGRLNDGTRIRF
jgi:hypothetical protein